MQRAAARLLGGVTYEWRVITDEISVRLASNARDPCYFSLYESVYGSRKQCFLPNSVAFDVAPLRL